MIAENNHYDAIVIGSGMGGLTTASLLAQLGKKRVLVLERHFKLGGFTHSFRRKDFEWDVGLHYVGEMQKGSLMRGMMNLVTDCAVKWKPMGSPFETFIFPEGSFGVPSDLKEYIQSLKARFPHEQQAIAKYFQDVKKAQGWMIRWFVSKALPKYFSWPLGLYGKRLAGMRTQEYLDAHFRDPLLKSILTAQWPDYGTPPAESAFGIHATVAADYFHGGFFPVGGAKEIAQAACQVIKEYGGDCLVSHEASEIIIQNGAACGVRVVKKGRTLSYYAPMIISNAGPVTTFQKLVPPEFCVRELDRISRLKNGTSAIILFLGLKDDPQKHGFGDCNYWIYSQLDHNEPPITRIGLPPKLQGVFVSFSETQNPGKPTTYTAQVISFGSEDEWQSFQNSEWKNRGQEYEQLKEVVAGELLEFANARMPGLRELVAYQELSTPLTIKSFTGHWGGAIYGQANDPNRLFRDQWSIVTSVRNLYLTGSDAGTSGINGALMGGAMAAARLLGPLGLPRVMMRASQLKDK